jgi:hypothetical protein
MKLEKEEYLNGLLSRINEFVAEKDRHLSQLREENEQVVDKLRAEIADQSALIESLSTQLADSNRKKADEESELKTEPLLMVEAEEPDEMPPETQVPNQNSKQIAYGNDLVDHPEYENIRFSVNQGGHLVVSYNNYVDLCSRVLVYNAKGNLVKKTDFTYLVMTGLASDTIFVARCAKSKIDIQSFSLKMTKKHVYTEDVLPILGYYSIDNDGGPLVYFKVQTKLSSNGKTALFGFSYSVYAFDKTLNKVDMFCFDEPSDLFDLKIKNGVLVYFSSNGSHFNFAVKSIKSRETLHRFELTFDSLFGYDIGPNGKLYIINKKQNMLNEYELSGKFVQTTRLNVSSYHNVSELCITNNFDFVVNDKFGKNIYYLINGALPKRQSLKTFVKSRFLKMRVSTA